MNQIKAINELIRIICKDLGIKKPKVKTVQKNEVFSSDTQLAAYDIENDVLYLKNNYDTGLDLYFVIAHELRHKYQYVNGMFNIDEYKHTDEVSIEEYNLQFVEIDANAYAYLIMTSLFKRAPLYKGLSENVKNKIMERAKEIYEENMENS